MDPMIAEDTTADDEFAVAFDQLNDLGDKPVPDVLAKPDDPPVEAEAGKSTTVEGDEPPVEAPVAEVPPVEGDQPAPVEKPAPAAPDETTMARFAQIAREQAAQEAAAREAVARQVQQQQPRAPAPLYTQEEQQIIDAYHKDWPDVARVEALKRRGEYSQLVNHVQQQVAARYDAVINNLVQHVQTLAVRTQYSDLTTEVPDYDDVRDKAIEWASQQPAWLQVSLARVINEGTPEEIKGLIGLYKQSTGANVAPQPKPATELPTATKKAAAALAPVSSKRSAVITGDDPNDFEGAFSKFADMDL